MRENVRSVAVALALAAVSACGGDGSVEPLPPNGPPAVAQRVAMAYKATDLPAPAGRVAFATALSDSGEVVGWDVASDIAASPDLTALPASYTSGSWSVTTSGAFSWSKTSGYHALPLPPNAVPSTAANVASFATAVDASGVIVGALAYVDTAANQFHEVPVRWTGGVAQLLPLPPGETHARAIDVDATGAVLLVRDAANEATWTWSTDAGYTQIAAGLGGTEFQPIRLTTLGIAGAEGGDIGAPMLMGNGSGTTWPQPPGGACSAYAFSWGGAALGWCASGGSRLIQMAVWPAGSRQPSLVATPADSVLLVVVSDGGVAAGYTRKAPRAMVVYDAMSGVVPLMTRVVNASGIAASSSGLLGIPVAINAHGTLLYSIRGYAPYILEPQ